MAVAVAIIGILASLILMGVNAARESVRRTVCSNNLKQIGLGLHNYVSTYRVFPCANGNGWRRLCKRSQRCR
ncbi:MAG: DUF1559 domain-containing protein [Pirellula sp.]